MAEYVTSGVRWASNAITWSFGQFNLPGDAASPISSPVTDAIEKLTVEAALEKWQSVANISFTQVADSPNYWQAADIRIGFGNLGTKSTGTVGLTSLTWYGSNYVSDQIVRIEDPAYLPLSYDSNGLLAYTNEVSSFYQVVLHEIGHALGLEHSSDPAAVMYSFAQDTNRNLSAADIQGIQSIYGAQTTAQPTTSGTAAHQVMTFDGPRADYAIAYAGETAATVTDSAPFRDGSAVSINNEVLQFTDQAYFIESGDRANIARLYSAALDRTPDTNGLFGWEDIYDRNVGAAIRAEGPYKSLAETSAGFNGPLSIADGFVLSPEFSAKYGSLQNSDFVTQLYENVLSRAPEPSGISGWLDLMANGDSSGMKFTRAMVLVGFAESRENMTKTTWLVDTSKSG